MERRKYSPVTSIFNFANPSTPLPAGFDDIGGFYKLAFVNNAAFPSDKILQVYWAGVRYTVLEALDLAAAYYGLYHQEQLRQRRSSAGCTTNVAATCSGTLEEHFLRCGLSA